MQVQFKADFFGPDQVFRRARNAAQQPITYDLPDDTVLPRDAKRIGEAVEPAAGKGGSPLPVPAKKD